MSVRTSAPGKVVLTGEYAVLDGAPAVVMAVNRRASVRVSARDGRCHSAAAPGLVEGEVDFCVGSTGEITRHGVGTPSAQDFDLSLVGRILAASVPSAPPLQLELDTREFFHPRKRMKLGFGSSAALSVALAAALLPAGTQRAAIAHTALSAHRAWQGGRGSGVDVAAAVHGGIVGYRTTPGAAVEALRWPAELRCAVLWSGRPAGTSNRIEAFRESVRQHGAADALADAAERMLVAWREGEVSLILDNLAEYVRALREFDVDRGLGIFDAGHGELTRSAAGPVVYKPCGAGGGDIGIALASGNGDLDEFVEKAGSFGFERLDVALDSRGVE